MSQVNSTDDTIPQKDTDKKELKELNLKLSVFLSTVESILSRMKVIEDPVSRNLLFVYLLLKKADQKSELKIRDLNYV